MDFSVNSGIGLGGDHIFNICWRWSYQNVQMDIYSVIYSEAKKENQRQLQAFCLGLMDELNYHLLR